MLGLNRWRPRQLLTAWAVYWATLFCVTLGSAVVAAVRVAVPKGAKGSIAAGFGDGGLYLKMTNGSAIIWDGSVTLTAAALWIAGPPLLIWIAWLLSRPARPPVTSSPREPADVRALGEGAIAPIDIARVPERERPDSR
jgi:hypothetical protein